MTNFKFRTWVYMMWVSNTSERLLSGDMPHSFTNYFSANKWWLKNGYKQKEGSLYE